MIFEWYQEIEASDEITQGDILTNCAIPIPNISVYDAVLGDNDSVEEAIDVNSANVIILSQACDIQNDKINTIVLCPIWPLKTLIEEIPYYRGSDARESLRQGKEPSYHLLQNYSSKSISMDFSVVNFHQIYTLPKDFLKRVAGDMPNRLRLLPPYREHLSQAFARYFMRVGLPSDISKDDIKNYKKS